MKRIPLFIGAILALFLVVVTAWAQITLAGGQVRTTFPSTEDPGPPFYARIEPAPPHVFIDGEWAAIAFYRDPTCVPEEFNLLFFFDPPAAFGCQLMVRGTDLWHDEPGSGAPKISKSSGTGAVPVWFVPVGAFQQATEDGELMIRELASLEGLLKGQANQFNEVLQPGPLPPELGGGGHPNPKLIQNAQGLLEDGRIFRLHVVEVNEQPRTINIDFQ